MSFIPNLPRHTLHTAAGNEGDPGAAGRPVTPGTPGLDLQRPPDNLYAFGKLWATYADEPVYSAFHGLLYGMLPGQRLRPLMGYAGFGGFQAKMMDDGSLRLRGKEVGFFTDPASGKVLESWHNPYTDETVPVFNFLNDRVRGVLTAEMPRFQFGDADDEPTLMNEGSHRAESDGAVPFILPWQRLGESVLLSWDYTHHYRNPVTPERWPRASTGRYINPSEHFTFNTRWDELADRDRPCARFHCGFSRLSPWWPWMLMGGSGIDGGLFGRMHSHKSDSGLDDIPGAVLDYCERHHPDYLQPCRDWDDGQPLGTWEAYARDMPPESS